MQHYRILQGIIVLTLLAVPASAELPLRMKK